MRKLYFPFVLLLVFIHGCGSDSDRDDSSVNTFFSDFDQTGCEIVTLNGHTYSFETFVEYACEAEKMDYIKEYARDLSAKYPGVTPIISEDCGYWHYPPFGYAFASVDAGHPGGTGINIPDYIQDYPGKIIVRMEKHQ